MIVAAGQDKRPVAIVSNNSVGAIHSYLARHRLSQYFGTVIGRTFADPGQMKPNPEPILRAAKSLGTDPAKCILVGDSMADILGAQAAGMPVIAYANKPDKIARFTDARADLVVTSMATIADVLIEQAAG